jgi:uncharacterized protein YhaN
VPRIEIERPVQWGNPGTAVTFHWHVSGAREAFIEAPLRGETYGVALDGGMVVDIEPTEEEFHLIAIGLDEQGDGLREEVLRVEAESTDADAAKAEVDRLETEIERRQRESQEAAQVETIRKRELEELQARNGIGGAAHEANAAAAEMLGHLERWLQLKAAGMILSRAAERYRAANQNPLVRRASEIFQAVVDTGDNPIERLAVDYGDEDQPVLVGHRRDGALCPVAGMSAGTADQLYLALRIAAIERYMESGEPMPFIADDLFITSDEDRTVPGIKALAELGTRTQVLLFTHHRYVVEAAAAALPPEQLRVHLLGGEVLRELECAD